VERPTSSLESRLKEQALALGFDLAGIAPASEADGFDRLRDWLDRGFAGEMAYMHRHAEARRHPSAVLPEVRTVVMFGMTYGERGTGSAERRTRNEKPLPEAERGEKREMPPTYVQEASPAACGSSSVRRSAKIARYARGPDYHDVLRDRLNRLLHWLQTEVPGCVGRGVVDTAPLLERDFARRAGLGWIGKNTMLINKRRGSFLFLGALLVNLELQPDAPHKASHCGTCTACLEACPTDAFAGPGWLDARRCISYLTIELRSSIPTELRSPMGDWLFGCDICQEVCPWNKKPARDLMPSLADADVEALDPVELLKMSEEEFRQRFRGTALMRTRRRGLLRNAAIVLGNLGGAEALPVLRQALDDPEPLVREAAAWAIEQIEQRTALSLPATDSVRSH
jgi:epoxyqueuosine reductase